MTTLGGFDGLVLMGNEAIVAGDVERDGVFRDDG